MVETFKCKNCGGDLKWIPEKQGWVCEWCDTEHTKQDFEQFEKELETKVESDGIVEETDAGVFVTYKCTYCAAEVVTTQETSATICLYCQRPVVLESNVSGEFKPEVLIPFKNTREDALERFKGFLHKKRFLPDEYIADQNIQRLTGVYIPFWLYDAKVDFEMKGEGDIVKSRRSGNYQITTTDIYRVSRQGVLEVKKVPVDASKKTPDALMNSIEPFDYAELTNFATPYLSGFLAERWDEDATACYERAKERMYGSAKEAIDKSLSRYTTIRRSSEKKKTRDVKSAYGLLPVWLLYSQFKGKEYIYGMNGQTGKMLGNLPIDPKKVVAFAAKVFAISGPASVLIGFLVEKFLG